VGASRISFRKIEMLLAGRASVGKLSTNQRRGKIRSASSYNAAEVCP
jgi:hypothetical protein